MTKRNFQLALIAALICCSAQAQTVSNDVMQRIYDEVKTPYKYGLVVAPTDNYHKFDCPTVFREGDKWLMTYVCYDGKEGTDGRGYETWLAESDDLLHWKTLGKVLNLPTATDGEAAQQLWDQNQRGGFPSLIDWTWNGTYEMQAYKGRHWMTYIGGPGTGYEAVNAPLSIGVATTKSSISSAHQWQTYNEPLLSYNDKDAQWWEQMTQYKSTIYWIKDKQKRLQKNCPFTMFYNAGGKDDTHPKGERIGIALSKDMKHWHRYDGNPVFAHDSDGTITGDAQLVDMSTTPGIGTGDGTPLYVMFYFSAFNPTRDYNAFNTFAVSTDLVHWQDWTGPDLIIPSKPYDETFAHKSYVVKHDGVVYHFYCAVNSAGQRGIAVATSQHMGKSEVNFPTPEPGGHRTVIQLMDDWTITSPTTPKPFKASLPINLDDYYGTQQGEHGNLHGEALFEKTFTVPSVEDKACFLCFEGVGTYADISLNGHQLGHYDVGRTTLTVDVTPYIKIGGDNKLTVKVSHPAGITNMPWVCGGCSSEWGFSEGSQPFGIYRPVALEITDKVRVEPFGVHVWNNDACDSVFVETELHNYGTTTQHVQLVSKFMDKSSKQVLRLTDETDVSAGQTVVVRQSAKMADAKRWSTSSPYLYDLNTIVKRNGKATESTHTPFGFVTLRWPRQIDCPATTHSPADGRFRLNGEPVFINGVCEYEHAFGQSHAFSNEQIDARVKLVKDAGFNAFRDAHQPHNLHYQEVLDREGILWWPQFSAHIWYDTPEFRESFKRHLRQWVKERRNSPSVILWGLQNESTLPKDFAEECSAIIREMDPRCRTQRLITTCNGGEGTDWNVVQNWSGTYGGDIDNYANELKQPDQLLNGEYGAWRTLGNHTGENYTEERFGDLLMKKVQLAESVRDSVCGQFLWLLVSHDNPGRRQPDEALRMVDKVGPFNYKGLLSPWEQPTDAFYRYMQHYNPQPLAPRHSRIDETVVKGAQGYNYLYRLNCGGDEYTDEMGQKWMQDNSQWSRSWGDDYGKPYQTSQTRNDSLSSPLFQTSRFGRHKLSYHFPASPGRYRVELYFVEPWYRQADAEGLRLFDVAVNDSTVIHDLDIWAQVHYGKAYKRVVDIENHGQEISISFPKVKAGQAMISAIAIAKASDDANTAVTSQMGNVKSTTQTSPTLWTDFEKDIMVKTPDSLLPPKSSTGLEVEGKKVRNRMEWDFSVGVAKVYALRWKYYNAEKPRVLHVKITDAKGVVYKDDDVTFLQTQQKKTKRKSTSITTGSQVNAGTYHVVLTGDGLGDMVFDPLTIE
ncbi:MAG: beta-galactosidase [Prevotella sp.]|nr:beta-galactosidase [Prevotella sp.]